MNTGKRLLAVAVLSAAPLVLTGPAHAQIVCVRAPCTVAHPRVVQTTARYVHSLETRGFTCAHENAREWLCVTYGRYRR